MLRASQPLAVSISQTRSTVARCSEVRVRNSNPCRRPCRYRTIARNFMGTGLNGIDNSIDTTSPGDSSPVNVAPIPSIPSSLERPQNDIFPSSRKTCTETRISNPCRGYLLRRANGSKLGACPVILGVGESSVSVKRVSRFQGQLAANLDHRDSAIDRVNINQAYSARQVFDFVHEVFV